MSETKLLIIEIIIAIYIVAGLYVTAPYQENPDASDSRLLLEKLGATLLWPLSFVNSALKSKIAFLFGLAVFFVSAYLIVS